MSVAFFFIISRQNNLLIVMTLRFCAFSVEPDQIVVLSADVLAPGNDTYFTTNTRISFR